jgi:hypothetical protein
MSLMLGQIAQRGRARQWHAVWRRENHKRWQIVLLNNAPPP